MSETEEAEEAEEQLPDLAGSTIGKYSIVQLIGRGGMGRVYEAINPTIKKRVAIKILDPEYAKKRETAGRFTREAQAASAAESPHIVEIFDAGFTDDGVAFIVMELLRGEPLSERIKREGLLDPPEAKRIFVQIVRGLVSAHDAGIVHRDLKPDNVFLVDRDPDPPFTKILDFGISKVEKLPEHTTLTREGVVLGTPWYMSPEQAQGHADVDARSDIWSVGAMLYQCLSGKLPFTGNTYAPRHRRQSIRRKHRRAHAGHAVPGVRARDVTIRPRAGRGRVRHRLHLRSRVRPGPSGRQAHGPWLLREHRARRGDRCLRILHRPSHPVRVLNHRASARARDQRWHPARVRRLVGAGAPFLVQRSRGPAQARARPSANHRGTRSGTRSGRAMRSVAAEATLRRYNVADA